MRLLLLLFIFVITLYPAVGKIASMTGAVTIDRSGKKLQALQGSILEVKDRVETSKNAQAQILFQDESIVSIGSDSSFEIEDYLFQDKNSRAQFKMQRGYFKTSTGKIGKLAREQFRFKTRTAVIGIKGTIFKGKITENAETIICTEGAITVTKNLETFNIDAGELTEIKEGLPTVVREYRSLDLQRIEKNLSPIFRERDFEEEYEDEYDENHEEEEEHHDEEESDEHNEEEESEVDEENEHSGESHEEEEHHEEDNEEYAEEEEYELIEEDLRDSEENEELEQVEIGSDEYYSWGYWINDDDAPVAPYLEKDEDLLTSQEVLEEFREASTTATYSGDIIGIVEKDETLYEKMEEGSFSLDVNFANKKVAGGIFFESFDKQWNISIDGAIEEEENLYEFTNTNEVISEGITIDAMSGSGTFEGDEAQKTSGEFEFNTQEFYGNGKFVGNKEEQE